MFERVNLEISNICNVQCSFCPVVERDNKLLSPEQFTHILKQVAPLTKEVCLHLMGEPLVHPKLHQLLQIAMEVGTPIQITTNGLGIVKHQAMLLEAKCLRQLNFSLQSYVDNFPHRPLHLYMQPLLQFCKLAMEHRPDLYINFRLWNLQSSDKAEQNKNAPFIQQVEEFFNVKINQQVEIGAIRSKRILGRLYFHFDTRFDWPDWKNPHQGTTGYCHALKGHIGIHADGTVVPCCLDKEAQIPLGNCLEQDLQDILQSPRALKMRQGFEQRKLVEAFCQHCTYIKRFQK